MDERQGSEDDHGVLRALHASGGDLGDPAQYLVAIGLISLATAAHQGWSANLSRRSPTSSRNQRGVGNRHWRIPWRHGRRSLHALLPAYLVTHFGYEPVFVIMGSAHLIAFMFMHTLMGKMGKITPKAA